MADNPDSINQLLEKLEGLIKRQNAFSREILELKTEIVRLKNKEADPQPEKKIKDSSVETPEIKIAGETAYPPQQQSVSGSGTPLFSNLRKYMEEEFDLEKFIGENLINKIGIAVTIIGVAIGAKYTIEHDLITPLTRIILGYLAGLALLVVGIRLKTNYANYSAVLVSGAMAIMYFITYFAYSFYGLFPQVVAFALMLVFTIFTVVAALSYDKQVIAHIGLVGAYAVPFFLSEDSGQVAVLFSYVAIINTGILVIAFRKYWKPLYYAAFLLTWLIYSSWYFFDYKTAVHFELASIFLGLFFAIFYLTFLAYKLIQQEQFSILDVLLLLANSFIFYGIGYYILEDHETGSQLLGLFTLGNAFVHFIVSVVIYRQKLGDRKLFYLISGLVLTFLTIAIPVQLDGHWVTLLWAGEAALLFWIGRTKNIAVYEKMSYALMLLAFISMLMDWNGLYNGYQYGVTDETLRPVFNINFLSSLLFIAAFGFINVLNRNEKYPSPLTDKNGLLTLLSFGLPAILLFTIYTSGRLEVAAYFDQLYENSNLAVYPDGQDYQEYYRNEDLPIFKNIWIINYSLLFLVLLSFLNKKRWKNRSLGFINLGLNLIAIGAFLTIGLYGLSELRESYLDQHLAQYYDRGIFNILIRYISFVFMAGVLWVSFKYIRAAFLKADFRILFEIVFHLSVLWIASSELISWMDLAKSEQSYKLGLSILWGVYALLLIVQGIWKRKTYLRVGAIVLFAVTLLKLFFYDVADLDTIAKTIVFVSLGVLLLIISFLYNKYKHHIFDEA